MNFKPPKNTEKRFWTRHAIYKLRQYGLSAQRVVRVINNPQRKEEGIVPKTVAVMQPSSTKNKGGKKFWSQEIWAMYQIRGGNEKWEMRKEKGNIKNLTSHISPLTSKIKIISVWRYPGMSPKKDPIPEEILREITDIG